MGRAKCKKKAMERAKCKKNATGQFVVSRIWERQPTGWNHKTTTSSTFFFPCVSLCVDLHTPLLLKQWSGQHDVSNTQFFYMPTQNTDAWLTFIFLFVVRKRKERHPLKNGSPYKSVVLAGPAYRRSWNWPCGKKKENESCIFLVVFNLQLYFEVAFFSYLCCIFNSCQGT